MNPIKILSRLYWNFLASPVKYAKHIGVKIGENCLISTRNWSSEPYLITIGNNVQVTKDVYFHTHGGAHVARTKISNFDVFGKIVVEDDSYIGSGSHIMPGVTIGRNALVAAGSVVTHSVPAFEVWGGAPAKKISTVDEFIKKNISFNLGTKGLSTKEKRQKLNSLSDEYFLKK